MAWLQNEVNSPSDMAWHVPRSLLNGPKFQWVSHGVGVVGPLCWWRKGSLATSKLGSLVAFATHNLVSDYQGDTK